MAYFQTPQLNYVNAENVTSGPTSLFLASMHAGMQAKLQQREAANREAQLAQQAGQFDRTMEEKAIDNVRADRQIDVTDAQMRDRLKQEKELKDIDNRRIEEDKQREAALKAYDATAAGDVGKASAIVNLYPGGAMDPRNPRIAQPQQAAAPAVQPAPAPVATPPVTRDPDAEATQQPAPQNDKLEALMQQAAPLPPPPPAPPAVAAEPMLPTGTHRIQMPRLPPILASQFAAADAQRAARMRAAELAAPIVAGLKQASTTPFALRAIAEVEAAVKSGALPADKDALYKAWIERTQHLEDQANSTKRAGMTSGLAGRRLEVTEARPVLAEMDKANEDVIRKGGLRDNLIHSETALKELKANKKNPVAWVNAIDAAIRTNTGRAAIKAQFDLYMGHAHGTADQFEAWKNSFLNGLPSDEQQKNLMQAFQASNATLRKEAKEAHENFRRYDTDPRIADNPTVKHGYEGRERAVFGRMPGYGESEGPPPGAITGTLNGKRGYVLNGQFHETGGK